MKINKVEINGTTIFIPLDLKEKYKILLFFTTRNGGFSKGKYSSLNTSYYLGDNIDSVKKNRLKILSLFGYDKATNLFSLNQIHSNRVLIINDNFLKKIFISKNNFFNSDGFLNPKFNGVLNADAMITDISLLPLMVMGADCNLVLIADIKKRVIAAVHAGWRGVLNQIIVNAINNFKNIYNSDLKDILVFIGPSIRKCCFKVTKDTFNLFYLKFKNKMNFEEFKDNKENINYYFIDLVSIIKNDLCDYGILKSNISDTKLCTYCNNENLFFSYRKRKETGRQAGIIMLE
ncbi:MAG: peptidoglycan editing factor PgeF [Actinobacteria bacterium]|nr:peptidoglycan editing factor PgeF [Actinomycetota bacterium]